MNQFKNLLVATDTRLDNHPIIDEAFVIASHCGASLTLVDVVPTIPWIVRLSLPNHEEVRKLMIREKETRLEALAAPIRERGIQIDTLVLNGKTSVEIVRQVLQGNHDLVLSVAKGKGSRRDGFFGTTSMRLLRDCPCAVWLVTASPSTQYKHVMACVDTSSDEPLDAELNDKVYSTSKFVSQVHNSKVSIVHAWKLYGEEFLISQMRRESFAEFQKEGQERFKTLLDTFMQSHGSSVRARNVKLLKGDASLILPVFARKNKVDLVVMGTVARSGAAGLLIGNTAERILNRLECSVLALKPDSFVCPISWNSRKS